MDHPLPKSRLGLLIVLGSVWGLSEAALGMGLRNCAAQVSGSLMTGVALSFIAAGWAISRGMIGPLLRASIAFILFVSIIKEGFVWKLAGQALLGGLAAVLAANLFPLVKYAIGIPACVVPGTGYPLSLHYVHFAVVASLVTVPLGFLAGPKSNPWRIVWSGPGSRDGSKPSSPPLPSFSAWPLSPCSDSPESAADRKEGERYEKDNSL